jgi:hypothetical protein
MSTFLIETMAILSESIRMLYIQTWPSKQLNKLAQSKIQIGGISNVQNQVVLKRFVNISTHQKLLKLKHYGGHTRFYIVIFFFHISSK